MNIMINTLEFAESFEQAGFDHDKARALAGAFAKAQESGREDLVTKPYLDARLSEMKVELIQAISDQNVSLTKAISEVGKDLTGRLWSTIAIIAGVSTAISATIGAGLALILR